jgi:hypothetical protein
VLAPRLKVSVTVEWTSPDTTTTRLTLWAREDGREVFGQTVEITPPKGSSVHTQDFWIEGIRCQWLLVHAAAWASWPHRSQVYRLLPFECGE